MMSPEGYKKRMSCILKSQSPRTTYSQVRLVHFDQSYVVHRLQKVLQPFVRDFTTNALLEITKSAIEG